MSLLNVTGNCSVDDVRRLAYEIYLARISKRRARRCNTGLVRS
jgi:hypothetical protein